MAIFVIKKRSQSRPVLPYRERMRAKVRRRTNPSVPTTAATQQITTHQYGRLKGKPLGKPLTKKRDFLKALDGTAGVKAIIATNLGIARQTVVELLKRPDWEDMREAWRQERAGANDMAEDRLRRTIGDDKNPELAVKVAMWLLSRVRPKTFSEQNKVTVQGGDKPIRTQNLHVHAGIPIESLNLPIETQRQLLELADAKEEADSLADVAVDAVAATVTMDDADLGDNTEEQ